MEMLKHECGIAMVRLLKPLSYYQEHYGTWRYGLNKLYLLMEKQHNRGQDGAGIACIKTEVPVGEEYIFRERAMGSGAISEIFDEAARKIQQSEAYGDSLLKTAFAGNMYMGHLRYSTTGRQGTQFLHPLVRRDNYRTKSLSICGNFNLTNTDEVFDMIVAKGQNPRGTGDTFVLLEQLGHRLDREVDRLYMEGKEQGLTGLALNQYTENRMEIARVLRQCAPYWDGGYVICGMNGSGQMFSLRDPWGIRPAFYYKDDEVVVVASERPVIMTAMNVLVEDVHELQPGQAILVNKANEVSVEQILEPKPVTSKCSFERIYFSRGSDKDIYQERKRLGYNLVPAILKACDNDLLNTVISFIPNTAEVAYYGMLHGFEDQLNMQKAQAIAELSKQELTEETIRKILSSRVRSEKVAIKDIKLRTFITENSSRNDMAAHVYDVTYGIIRDHEDNLVVIDDSIVRGTTLKNSIIKILSRLRPKKLIIVSSSPQVRYPDFYGIDMSNMHDFIAFKAAIALLEERGMTSIIDEVYRQCKAAEVLPKEQCVENYVKAIYAPFSDDDISKKICELVAAGNPVPVECIFQTLDGLHQACPDNQGDWYFSGDYPTPGGMKRLYRTFVDYYENFRMGRQ
ncbi:MAG: amidophosphoribosyltransferase [Bacteroidales bacterium]|nr:amidophosphoribosyltransferase [Bacteroidales bacterium]